MKHPTWRPAVAPWITLNLHVFNKSRKAFLTVMKCFIFILLRVPNEVTSCL